MNKFLLLVAGVIALNGCASKKEAATTPNDLPDPMTDYPYDVASTDPTVTSGDVAPMDPIDTTVTPDNSVADNSARDNVSTTATTEYKVKAGDSLWKIANGHNTTVAKLKKINNLSSDKIKIGQTLQVPQ